MATLRLLPPASGNQGTIKVHGRTYTAATGSFIDVPDFDAGHMLASGWLQLSTPQASGVTTARPTKLPNGLILPKGYTYLDTTLGYAVLWDGLAWRNPCTGAAV
jgi:hypothetical protein